MLIYLLVGESLHICTDISAKCLITLHLSYGQLSPLSSVDKMAEEILNHRLRTQNYIGRIATVSCLCTYFCPPAGMFVDHVMSAPLLLQGILFYSFCIVCSTFNACMLGQGPIYSTIYTIKTTVKLFEQILIITDYKIQDYQQF